MTGQGLFGFFFSSLPQRIEGLTKVDMSDSDLLFREGHSGQRNRQRRRRRSIRLRRRRQETKAKKMMLILCEFAVHYLHVNKFHHRLSSAAKTYCKPRL
ncbi:unnamed protein product [Linum trigynum]|uniref:Uncharacterized protein n=1 Tax=Linum trigynum TaxID=586398 RepID=A0AAV2GKA9_9ROSI